MIKRMRFGCTIWALMQGIAAGAQAADCTVNVPSPYHFGSYDTLNDLDIAIDYTVTCSRTTQGVEVVNVVVTFSPGSGTYAQRTMSNGSSTLTYNLYKDAARTQIRGDGTAGTVTGTARFVLNAPQSTQSASGTIYGRIFGGQNVTPGTYSTTIPITVTMTF